MKKLLSVVCVLAMVMMAMCAVASAEETVAANWAYGALPLNSEDAGVGTI